MCSKSDDTNVDCFATKGKEIVPWLVGWRRRLGGREGEWTREGEGEGVRRRGRGSGRGRERGRGSEKEREVIVT